MIEPIQPQPQPHSTDFAMNIFVKVLPTVTVLIFAFYTLPSSSLALSLRQFSSPIFVFLLLNTAIFLLSLPHIFPPPAPTHHTASATTAPIIPSPAPIEDELEPAAQHGSEIETTEMRRRSTPAEDVVVVEKEEEAMTERRTSHEDEEVSNAEFNRIIEAFLAKQKRFHYQESISILV